MRKSKVDRLLAELDARENESHIDPFKCPTSPLIPPDYTTEVEEFCVTRESRHRPAPLAPLTRPLDTDEEIPGEVLEEMENLDRQRRPTVHGYEADEPVDPNWWLQPLHRFLNKRGPRDDFDQQFRSAERSPEAQTLSIASSPCTLVAEEKEEAQSSFAFPPDVLVPERLISRVEAWRLELSVAAAG